jgi:hypothetical protein
LERPRPPLPLNLTSDPLVEKKVTCLMDGSCADDALAQLSKPTAMARAAKVVELG